MTVTVSADGVELGPLAESLRGRGRVILGLTGAPGAGKSLLASVLVRLIGPTAALVPMDGFHLPDAELDRLGLRLRKGAPSTFDVQGYAALLETLRSSPRDPVDAPAFDREVEQPVPDAIQVGPEVEVVVTEGNYLLLDLPEWQRARSALDEVWYLVTDERLRAERLVARHVEFGKGAQSAGEWVRRVDEPNARMVEASRHRADLVVDLTAWQGHGPG